jgi:putative Mn2+ efflux pump MntP
LIDVETFFLAIALGCDAFAVGLGVGTRCCAPRQVFRLCFHFGLFQFLMPLLGWYLGLNLIATAKTWGPWIAFALLLFLGLKMAYESLGSAEKNVSNADPTRGITLVVLSLATSMDALGVGFSLGILGRALLVSALWIGITAGIMTLMAMKMGERLSERFGRRMGIVGGGILVIIAFKLVNS